MESEALAELHDLLLDWDEFRFAKLAAVFVSFYLQWRQQIGKNEKALLYSCHFVSDDYFDYYNDLSP